MRANLDVGSLVLNLGSGSIGGTGSIDQVNTGSGAHDQNGLGS